MRRQLLIIWTIKAGLNAAFIATLSLSTTAPAAAQVYEIGAGGAVQIRDGAGEVAWRDAAVERIVVQPPIVPTSTSYLSPILPNNPLHAPLHTTAARYGLSPALLDALVWQESRWHSGAVSPKGAVGLTQLMPATARAFGVDPRDPAANLDAGAHYLRQLLDQFGGNLVWALAAYNAGPDRVVRARGIPPIRETRDYVAAILARLSATSPAKP